MNLKRHSFLFLLFILNNMAIAQDIIKIESQIDSLNIIKSGLESSLDSIKDQIKKLNRKKIEIQVADDTAKGIEVALIVNGKFRDQPNQLSNILLTPPAKANVLVIGYIDTYFKVIYDN